MEHLPILAEDFDSLRRAVIATGRQGRPPRGPGAVWTGYGLAQVPPE